MAAEVAAFLLEEKLRTLLNDEAPVYPGLRLRMKEAVTFSGLLSRFFRSRELSPERDEDPITPRLLNSVYLADDLVDVYQFRKAQQRRKGVAKWSPLLGQRDLKEGINKFINEVREVSHAGCDTIPREMLDESLDRSAFSGSCRWQKISHLMDVESNVVGQESDMEKLVAELLCDDESVEEDKEFRVLSIVGPCNSGKTTMVRRVYDRAQVKNHFNCYAWVCVSREFSFRDVVFSIMEQMSIPRLGDVDHLEDKVLSNMLLKTLMEKRYLIVLDDVFNVEAWYALTIPLPASRNGSRVILMTSERDVAELVDPWAAPLHLQRLSDDEMWKLLLKQVGGREHNLNEARDVIMNKNWDSPPVAVLLGGTLSVMGNNQLPALIKKLTSADGASSDLVGLCFHELPPRLKVCFLYLGLFPRGFDIPVRRILQLWLSEGFLNPSLVEQKMKLEPEDLANGCFEELCNRRLIEVTKWKLDGWPKTCRVLGFLHDHFFERSMASGFFHVHWGKAFEFHYFPLRFLVRRLFKHTDIKTCWDHYVDQNLRTFVSFKAGVRGAADIDTGLFLKRLVFGRGFSLLKALDLEGVYKPLLPEEVGNMVLLRYLGLRSTVLESIPSFVGDLPCLETLDLKHTTVEVLPESIWKAKSLRHLYLNKIRVDEFIRKPAKGFLTNLQTLRGLYVGNKKAVPSGLTNLRKLWVTCHKNAFKEVCSWILGLPNLQSLKLRSPNEFGESSDLQFNSLQKLQKMSSLYLLGRIEKSVRSEGLFPMNVQKLTLSMCELHKDPMAALGQLPHLRILRLLARSYKGEKMTCVRGGFNQLRELKLWMLDSLERWVVEESSMPLVRKLEIRRCDNLETIIGLSHLLSLKDLILTNMTKIIDKVKQSVGQEVHVKENNWEFSHSQVGFKGSNYRSHGMIPHVKS